MVERWHLELAAIALATGLVIAGADRWAGARAGRHAIGVAGLAGAVLGGWNNPRWWPWLVGALVLAVWPDDVSRSRPVVVHPLGAWTVALTVVSLAGVWSAVPDTEPPLAAGCALAGLGLQRLVAGRPVGRPGTAALVVAAAGAAWVGSAGWGAAMASTCAVGMVLCAPLAVGFGRSNAGLRDRRPFARPTLIGTHLVVALTVPRLVMGLDVSAAATIAVGALLAMTAVARVVGGGRPRDGEELDAEQSGAPDAR